MTTEGGVAVDRLTREYGNGRGIHDVSFRLPATGAIGLIGLNGAGKSTLLSILATAMRADRGGFTLDGIGPHGNDLRRVRRIVGFMPQGGELPSHLRVGDALRYAAWLRGLAPAEVAEAARRELEHADLAERERSKIGDLSGGMQRRLLLAQAMVHEPRLLLLDEPTTGLDPKHRRSLRERIGAVAEDRLVLFSSHVLEDVVAVCGRILALQEGRLAFDGTVGDFWQAAGPAARAERDVDTAFAEVILGE